MKCIWLQFATQDENDEAALRTLCVGLAAHADGFEIVPRDDFGLSLNVANPDWKIVHDLLASIQFAHPECLDIRLYFDPEDGTVSDHINEHTLPDFLKAITRKEIT